MGHLLPVVPSYASFRTPQEGNRMNDRNANAASAAVSWAQALSPADLKTPSFRLGVICRISALF
jgi:hypothetical protein